MGASPERTCGAHPTISMTVLKEIDIDIREHELLAPYTIFKIGGPARWFFVVKNSQDLFRIAEWITRMQVPFVVLGGGSNVLVNDRGFEGLVIRMEDRSFALEGEQVSAAAGAIFAAVAKTATDNGLSGLEWAFGIPGTVGGAVRGNAGAFGGSTADCVLHVEILDGNTGILSSVAGSEMAFEYRRSMCAEKKSWIVTRATLQLVSAPVGECKVRLAEFLEQKKSHQPLGHQCAGCAFKNIAISRMNPDAEIQTEFLQKGFVPAGYLIEKAHMKNHVIGRAMVSPKHANFMINLGGASAADIYELMQVVKERVYDYCGVLLEEEVQYIGF